MKGMFFSGDEPRYDPYRAIMLKMIMITFQHAHRRELEDVSTNYQRNEVLESRCYLLSDKFLKDCELIDDVMTPAVIEEVRKCKWSILPDRRCAVCGCYTGNRYRDHWMCFAHTKIIKAYNEDPDILEEIRIAEEKRKPKSDRQVYLPYWRKVKEGINAY